MTTYDTSHLTTEERAQFNALLERQPQIVQRWTEDISSGDPARAMKAQEKSMRCAEAMGLSAESAPSDVEAMRRDGTTTQRTDRTFATLRILDEQ